MHEGRWDFFISYTESDRAWAEWIAWHLESAGFKVLVQAWDFVPGSHWVAMMDEGISRAERMIAVLSSSYLRSIYGQAEWQAAYRVDPGGIYRTLIPVRVEDTERPGIFSEVVSIDLFGISEPHARDRLFSSINAVLKGRSKPPSAPRFPGTEVEPDVLGSAKPPTEPRNPQSPPFPDSPTARRSPTREVGEVFQPTGIPSITFVQQELFIPFRMTLRQPGLSIVLEGPSGVGKTTLLTHAIEQDRQRFGRPVIYSARIPEHRDKIDRLVTEGHEGIVAIDDHHRLSKDQQIRVVDYMKQLADSGSFSSKIVIVGIPETARSLVKISPDIANRIRVFRPKAASITELLALIELGERALNIEFEDKLAIAEAAAGSLITAQALCWHLVTMAHIEETAAVFRRVPMDIREALVRVRDELREKYSELVETFVALDERHETICIDLLMALGQSQNGVVSLDEFKENNAGSSRAVEQVFLRDVVHRLVDDELITQNLYYDARGNRLIADDSQFRFYLKQLNKDELLRGAGKRLPTSRDRVFICYSHKDSRWLDRLLVHLNPLEKDNLLKPWSDHDIHIGDDWQFEIDAALDAARVAILLVSADFLASNFIRVVELPKLLVAAENGGCRVVPILVSASAFKQTPSIARFQHANPGGRTLAAMATEEAEQVLADVAQMIHELLT